jgi:hypothetical protein
LGGDVAADGGLSLRLVAAPSPRANLRKAKPGAIGSDSETEAVKATFFGWISVKPFNKAGGE